MPRNSAEGKDVQQSAEVLLRFLESDIRRGQVNQRLPFYVVFLILLMSTQLIENRGWNETSEKFYRQSASKTKLKYEEFAAVDGQAGFWKWLNQTAEVVMTELRPPPPSSRDTTLYPPHDPNQLLSMILVRQYRVPDSPENCHGFKHRLIQDKIEKYLRKSCVTDYDSSNLEVSPFSPNYSKATNPNNLQFPLNPPPWVTNKWRDKLSPAEQAKTAQIVRSIPVTGELHHYDEVDSAYTLHYSYRNSLADTRLEIDSLSKSHWIDIQTRVLVVDTLSYNAAIGTFHFNSFLLEVTASNAWVASIRAHFFFIFDLDDSPTCPVLLVAHCIAFILVIFDTYLSMLNVWKNRVLWKGKDIAEKVVGQVTFFGMLQTFAVVLLIFSGYYRVVLWKDSALMNTKNMLAEGKGVFEQSATLSDPDLPRTLALWEFLASYASTYHLAQTFLAMANCACWLRVLEFLQYNARLGVLTETMSASIRDLCALVLIFIIILMSYSVGHTLLWGNVVYYRSVATCMQTLTLILMSGDTRQYKEQEQEHSWLAPFFFATYVVLANIVVLNMVISVITGSFKMVQDEMQRGKSWSPVVLFHDAKKYVMHQVDAWRSQCQRGILKRCCAGGDSDSDASSAAESYRGALDGAGGLKPEPSEHSGGHGHHGTRGKLKSRLTMRQRFSSHASLSDYVEQKAGTDAERRKNVTLSTDRFYSLLKDARTGMTREMAHRMFRKASTEIRASAIQVKVSETKADEISDLLIDIIGGVNLIQSMERDTQKLQVLFQGLQETAAYFELFYRVCSEQGDSSDELFRVCRGLEDTLTLVTPILKDTLHVKSYHDTLIKSGRKTKELSIKAVSLSTMTESLEKAVDNKCSEISKAISIGQEDAMPTSMLAQAHPVLLQSSKGKGIVADVQAHGYIRQAEDDDDDLIAVPVMDIEVKHIQAITSVLDATTLSPHRRSKGMLKEKALHPNKLDLHQIDPEHVGAVEGATAGEAGRQRSGSSIGEQPTPKEGDGEDAAAMFGDEDADEYEALLK